MVICKVLVKNCNNGKKTSWLLNTALKRPFYQFIDMSINLLDENGDTVAKSVWPIIEDNKGYVIYQDSVLIESYRDFHEALKTFISFFEQNPNENWELRQYDLGFRDSRILEHEGKKKIQIRF